MEKNIDFLQNDGRKWNIPSGIVITHPQHFGIIFEEVSSCSKTFKNEIHQNGIHKEIVENEQKSKHLTIESWKKLQLTYAMTWQQNYAIRNWNYLVDLWEWWDISIIQ